MRYFDGKVKLDSPPKGILPGMTANVEISLSRREHVLAVPIEAVTEEDGREVCYVAHEDGLERREVKLGESTQSYLEISEGLHEGEQVVLKPVLSEVTQDTYNDTPLLSEASFTVELADAFVASQGRRSKSPSCTDQTDFNAGIATAAGAAFLRLILRPGNDRRKDEPTPRIGFGLHVLTGPLLDSSTRYHL